MSLFRKQIKLTKTRIYVLVIFSIIFLFLTALEAASVGRIAFGVKMSGIKLGGLSKEKASQKLVYETDILGKTRFELTYQNKKWSPDFFEIGINPNINYAINQAYQIGRNRGLIKNFWTKISSLFFGNELLLSANIDDIKFQNYYANNLYQTEQHPQNAFLQYNPAIKDFEATPSAEGILINQTQLKTDIINNFNNLSANRIQIITQKTLPEITEKDLIPAYLRATTISEKSPYQIQNEKNFFNIEKDQLIEWIQFERQKDNNGKLFINVELNKEKIKNFLVQISPAINKTPVNAVLTLKNGKVSEFALPQNGVNINVEKSAENISAAILNGQQKITLELKITEPEITIDKIDNLGLTSLIGTGTTNFSGSPSSRIHNIKTGAAKFNGTLIKPNQEFSFNEILGEVGPAQGYQAELVIKQNQTIKEFGGGLCQVSTTLFRAAVNAGLKITERYAHSYVVRYYGEPGFDATIYPPNPDLKFINNTPSNILIQTFIDSKNNIYFEIYGTDDGREVEVEKPVVLEKKDDGSMKTKFTQNVYNKSGELFLKKTFYSNYKPLSLYPIVRNPLE